MAASVASLTTSLPVKSNTPVLSPLITTTNTPRRSASQRHPSYSHRRLSAFSPVSKHSNTSHSRPPSNVFPAFHSSLPYTLVRDFAYPADEPLHYGPLPYESGLTTPASESRRLSDPAGGTSWQDARGEAGEWPATPPWASESIPQSDSHEQLPSMTFTDTGPPYSEDEDLHSPVVTASKNKKHKSGSAYERGRSPGAAGPNRGALLGINGDGSQQYYYGDHGQYSDENGPGGEIVNYPSDQQGHHTQPYNRDSNFAAPIRRDLGKQTQSDHFMDGDYSDMDEDNEDSRYSKDYSFTIASPDEEMHGKAVALFDFAREHENELPLKEGQIILVSYRHGQGWLVAEDPKTGESGLVPEEFVRLVRDIEGGLNGLGAVDIHEGIDDDTQEDPDSATTPTPGNHDPKHTPNASTGSNSSEKHPPVQSNFSTSSKDLDPYPLLARSSQDATSPARSELLGEVR